MQQLTDELNALKKLRLPWWGVLGGIVGSVLVAFLFDRVGRFDLARPTLYTVAMLAIAVAIKWNLRQRVWFWTTMAVLVALHFLLILLVPWTTKWIPALVIVPFGIMDLFAMLAVIAFVGRFFERNQGQGT